MPDQTIQCKDCQRPFTFTEKDQAFYQEKGFVPPKRCRTCRKIKKWDRIDRGVHPAELDKHTNGTYRDIDTAHGLYEGLPDGAYFAAMEEATGCDPSAIAEHFERTSESKPKRRRSHK